MRAGLPSATAQRVALRRAAHQLLDHPRVFDDPLALPVVGNEDAALLRADPASFETSRLSPYLRAFMAARSRFAEEELAAAVGDGTRQYVVLGAGLDTFAYRNPYPALRVLEVDHPATQAWKRQRLAEAGIAVPASLTFAPVDFEAQTLADGLRAAGFDPGVRTFFSWLGVTPYLLPETVMGTLRFVAATAAGSAIVFDFGVSPSLLDATARRVLDAAARRVAAVGEPWQALFAPDRLVADLRAMGFRSVEDVDPTAINARYFAGRDDGLRVGTLAHLMRARR